jgi:hypothetical protein
MDGFGCDALFNLLGQAGNNKQSRHLLCVLVSMVNGRYVENQAEITCLLEPDRCTRVRDCVAGINNFCKGIIYMLNCEGVEHTSAHDVALLTTYKGPRVFESTARVLLMGNPFWTSLADDAMKTGASCKTLGPRLKAAMTTTTSSDVTFDQLRAILTGLPELKNGLRSGATDTLEATLLNVFLERADGIVTGICDRLLVTSGNVDVILTGFQWFIDTDGVLEAQTKLQAWMDGHRSDLVQQDLSSFIETETAKGRKMVNNSMSKFMELLERSKNLTDDVMNRLQGFLPVLIGRLYYQACRVFAMVCNVFIYFFFYLLLHRGV